MRKVFIVDDEPFILEGLTSIIDWEQFGITLFGKASDGEEAFDILKETAVDILITDIMMRNMNGLELIERLKTLYPHMKFIVLSGYNEFDYVKQGMRLGIENYLLKPINLKELIETVESTMQKIERADLQASARQSQLDILRDNVLHRWATSKIDLAELRNRLEFLEIRTDFPFYAAAAIKIVHDSAVYHSGSTQLEGKKSDDVYHLCKKLTERSDRTLCFCDQDGDVIILFAGLDHNDLQAKSLSMLTRIRNEVKTLLHAQLLITFGSLELGYLGVSTSYHHSKRLQEFFLSHAENEILTYGQILAATTKSRPAAVDMFEYERLLLSKNKQKIYEYIDMLFAELQSAQAITPSQIHNCAVEMILCTKQIVKDNKLNHEQATSGYKQLFTTIFKAHTLSQLTAHVKFIADSAIDYLSTPDDEFSPVIKQVLHHIKTQFMEELSLKMLSQTLHIHPFYLGQLFQKETGVTFNDYLNSYRIKKAQKQLLTTSMKTSEISRNVGYLEPGYFYKQFKKYTGVSPTEYRNGKR